MTPIFVFPSNVTQHGIFQFQTDGAKSKLYVFIILAAA